MEAIGVDENDFGHSSGIAGPATHLLESRGYLRYIQELLRIRPKGGMRSWKKML